MSGRQALAVFAAVIVVAVVCMAVIFPKIYRSMTPGLGGGEQASLRDRESRSVLPKLKGVKWETAAQPAGEEKAPAKVQKKVAAKPESKEAAKIEVEAETEVQPKEAVPKEEEAEVVPLLEIRGWEWAEYAGFAEVSGNVKNISGQNMVGIQVHVALRDKEGQELEKEQAMIKLSPLFPGQVSPFELSLRHWPEVVEAVIDFRTFSGEKIPFREAAVD